MNKVCLVIKLLVHYWTRTNRKKNPSQCKHFYFFRRLAKKTVYFAFFAFEFAQRQQRQQRFESKNSFLGNVFTLTRAVSLILMEDGKVFFHSCCCGKRGWEKIIPIHFRIDSISAQKQGCGSAAFRFHASDWEKSFRWYWTWHIREALQKKNNRLRRNQKQLLHGNYNSIIKKLNSYELRLQLSVDSSFASRPWKVFFCHERIHIEFRLKQRDAGKVSHFQKIIWLLKQYSSGHGLKSRVK